MSRFLPRPRMLLLTCALLNACAAGGPTSASGAQGVNLGMNPGMNPDAAQDPPGVFGTYLAGRLAQSETDTATAADRMLDALRMDPDQPEVLSRAFMATLLDGRADAVRLARRLPNNQAAQILLIGVEAQAGRWPQAEARIRALPRNGPGQILQPLLLAWAQQGRGQSDAAIAILRPLAESGRLRGIYALHLALIADLANRPRDAERAIRTALAESPDPSLRLLLLGAGVLARAGQPAEAQDLLRAVGTGLSDFAMVAQTDAQRRGLLAERGVASAVEGIAEAHLALAAALAGQRTGAPGAAQGGGDGAMILARLALRLRPDFAPALLLVAEHYAEDRQVESALRVLRDVPAADPLAPTVQLRRASLLDRLDRLPEAEATLRRVATDNPAAPQPHARLGDLLRARSRFAEAADAYDAALARLAAADGTFTANAWPLLYARGIALERSQRWPRAEADFQRALELAPDQPYVLNYLAYTWVEQGKNLPEARRMLERAVALRPNDGNIVDSLGWALFRMGDVPAAVQTLERAVELEPRNSVINDHLGDAYWAAGRRAEARFQWRRALGQQPEAADIPKLEAKLRDGLPETPAATAQRRE
jgi:tetratricopeptide (TPR) repeat protein